MSKLPNINCVHYKRGSCTKFGRSLFGMFYPGCVLLSQQPCDVQQKHYNPINDLCPKKEKPMPVEIGDTLEVKIDLEEIVEKEVSNFEMFKIIDSTGERDMTKEEQLAFKTKMTLMRQTFDKMDKLFDELDSNASTDDENRLTIKMTIPKIKITL